MKYTLPAGFALFSALALVHAQEPAVRLAPIVQGLPAIVDIQSARDGSGRLFLARQSGIVRVFENGTLLQRPLLDLTSRTRGSGECGLLGLAFPPGFAEKRYFYVSYTDSTCSNSIVSRYRLSERNLADAGSEEVILRQSQPFENHNGGQLQFGPDGFLYIGFGDGGSGGDPGNRAQNRRTWLGKILRIDTESGADPYRVPPTNPFVNNAAALPEVWAYGLRNPWRFSFDRETGDLWIADVGQNRAEEVNVQPAASMGGENYGWRLMEGLQCFSPPNDCDRNWLTLPIHEYTRENGDVSVTGGYVYRGSLSPALLGAYIYADFASGRLWTIRREGDRYVNRTLRAGSFSIAAFGQDEAGEVLVADYGGGGVYRIEAPAAAPAPRISSAGVVNAASFEPGIVGGSLFSIFGSGFTASPGVTRAPSIPLPTTLGGVTVTIDGVPVPLLAVANSNGQEQINAQAPFGLSGGELSVTVSRAGATGNAVSVRRLETHPGVFAIEGNAIVVRSADNTLVTTASPVRRGEFVFVYATGLGPVENMPPPGLGGPTDPLARVRTPVTASLDGIPCEVQFAGLAPGFVGVYQLNIRIPAGVTAGPKSLVVNAGDTAAPVVRVPVE